MGGVVFPHCLSENARHRRWVVAAAAAERSVVRSAHHRARTTERGVARQHLHHFLCTAQCKPRVTEKKQREVALERGSQPGSDRRRRLHCSSNAINVSRQWSQPHLAELRSCSCGALGPRMHPSTTTLEHQLASKTVVSQISRPPSRHNRRDGGFAQGYPHVRSTPPPAAGPSCGELVFPKITRRPGVSVGFCA